LNASVWSRDHQEAESIASQLDYGTVCINDPYGIGFATYDAPMGGFKDSGIGRRHGPEGVKKYTQSRTIATSRIGPLADPPFVPTSIAVRGLDLMSRVQRQLNRYLY
jgi:succinate-semialdehyde dehydrogenase/glutarate-semialdehyde dehydrogenase